MKAQNNSTGLLIQTARIKLGMSRPMLAKLMGVTRQYVYLIETGGELPSLTNGRLEAFAEKLQIDCNRLRDSIAVTMQNHPATERARNLREAKTNRTEFGQRIFSIRMSKRISQKQLADRAGLHTAALSKIENGRIRKPRAFTLEIIEKALSQLVA